MRFAKVQFVKSVFKLSQLPLPELPEVAFAGRSNVGKSSLINRLLNRKNLVKVSSRPGKTQSLNFFLVDEILHLVDLPGYGYAKVPKTMQNDWRGLITSYLENRENLKCVVVIIDIRHSLKNQDRELIEWLKGKNITFLPIYTKADKLSYGQQQKQASLLDSALNIGKEARIIFSSKTGKGKENLIDKLDQMVS